MANEIRVQSSLTILAGNIDYSSRPTAFIATMTGRKGPVPGAITVAILGTDVDLSGLTTPGVCRLMNLDTTNYVEVGVWDNDGDEFFPLFELLPGESYVVRLSRMLGWEYGDVGTGTTGGKVNTLRLRANTTPCVVVVEAFEN